MGPAEDVRAVAARAAADSLRVAAAERFEECVRGLEAEKAKMEVFRRELPISVHLVADVIEWLKEEQRRRRPAVAVAAAKRKAVAPPEGVKAEADDKRSWMSSAQLWSCGGCVVDDSNGGVAGAKKPTNKVSNAPFMPMNGLQPLARSTTDASAQEKPAAMAPVPELSLSSPAVDAAPSATSSAVTQQQQAQRKARRCWSPELHRRFVAALQRLGGAQVATPKQIRELMKVDGLTNDEVKSHLQKYRLHTRRASSDGGGDQQAATMTTSLWSEQQQYATSQHSTSQSGSPQGPLQLAVSSRAVSVTGGDSCDGDEDEEEDGKSESYSWEMQRLGTKSSSS
ncbi:hypothetical protein PR202_gb24083 [Eleusine coracana subsp. coracana]|uniref:HTH myb-type domain-containing protein n=1 Tax=Eleusine coracana subsp. coracana TaxID=191504 RepID=A0AAV5FK53_ELECO|nr:hypothetical protein QOZ80_5BG0444300 [Eleusine coracana subsp. coracana]GJN35327.1 hypothetical protein PR202_gb24083 [Eleusine coracana subsp. coracana]